MIRQILTQARHELGLLRVLQECVVIPGALFVFLTLACAAGVIDG